jgi:hypothetical protein
MRWDARKLLALGFMAAVILPNLIAIALPAESWPYTNAPMFAHRVAPDTPRYIFVLEGQRRDGEVVELSYYSVGARWSLWRYFLKFVYGAPPSGGEFSVFSDDDRAHMEQRLSAFFSAFVDRYHARSQPPLDRMVLKLARVSGADNRRGEVRRLGTFDLAEKRYRHEWEPAP